MKSILVNSSKKIRNVSRIDSDKNLENLILGPIQTPLETNKTYP